MADSEAVRGPFRLRGGRPGPLGRQLSAALQGVVLSGADEVLVLAARAAADAADHARTEQDVKTFTAQVKWLRQLLKDLGLLDGSDEAEVTDDDDGLGAIVGGPSV